MGIEYYAFALFVTVLICLIAFLFKMLFADVKRQKKMLDEKESELLKLYRTVENVIEEFTDKAKAITKEIKVHEDRMLKFELEQKANNVPIKISEPVVPQKPNKLPRTMAVDSSVDRIKAAGEVIERAERVVKGEAAKVTQPVVPQPVFQRVLKETEAPKPYDDPSLTEKQRRNKKILELADSGKTTAQIAEELSISQNEVKLVIELGKQKSSSLYSDHA